VTIYFSQGSVATGLRGAGSFYISLLCRSFLNLTVKNYEHWSTVAEVIVGILLRNLVPHYTITFTPKASVTTNCSVLYMKMYGFQQTVSRPFLAFYV